MTDKAGEQPDTRPVSSTRVPSMAGPLAWVRGNRHLLIAAAIVMVVGVVVVAQGRVVKHAVPWPPDVEINSKLRLIAGFAETIGPYRHHVYEDKDGATVGDNIYTDELVEELDLKPYGYEKRVENRSSNWYVSRRFFDSTKDASSPFYLWQVNVYYYTGLRNAVPHVPEICLRAGGGNILNDDPIDFDLSRTDVTQPWRGRVSFSRVHYERWRGALSTTEGVEYYAFCYNGKPVSGREEVRLQMANLFETHNYFAKIQFTPISSVEITDFKQADIEAERFIQTLMPELLKLLPTQEQIDAAAAQHAATGGPVEQGP